MRNDVTSYLYDGNFLYIYGAVAAILQPTPNLLTKQNEMIEVLECANEEQGTTVRLIFILWGVDFMF